jgi:hypothetical protein
VPGCCVPAPARFGWWLRRVACGLASAGGAPGGLRAGFGWWCVGWLAGWLRLVVAPGGFAGSLCLVNAPSRLCLVNAPVAAPGIAVPGSLRQVALHGRLRPGVAPGGWARRLRRRSRASRPCARSASRAGARPGRALSASSGAGGVDLGLVVPDSRGSQAFVNAVQAPQLQDRRLEPPGLQDRHPAVERGSRHGCGARLGGARRPAWCGAGLGGARSRGWRTVRRQAAARPTAATRVRMAGDDGLSSGRRCRRAVVRWAVAEGRREDGGGGLSAGRGGGRRELGGGDAGRRATQPRRDGSTPAADRHGLTSDKWDRCTGQRDTRLLSFGSEADKGVAT